METRSSSPLKALGSVKLTLVLLGALAIVTGAATLIESAYGTTYAQATVYRTRWFEGLLILFAINMIVMFVVRWSSFERRQIGFVITHLSVIVILIGAGITRFFGYEGIMTIREGSSSDFIYSREDHVALSVGDQSANAEVVLYKAGGQNIHRRLEAGGETFDVTIREYWPHLTREWREGEGGRPMIALAAASGGQAEPIHLEAGSSESIAGTEVRFHGSGTLPTLADAGARGFLRASLGEESTEFPIPEKLPAEFVLAGQTIRVVELDPDFKVGREARPEAPMQNPALRLEVRGSDGGTSSRQLFALHPGFAMGDSLTGTARGMELAYVWSRSVHFALGPDGQVQVAADFPVQVTDPHRSGSGGGEVLAPGTSFALGPHAAVEAGSLSLRLEGAWNSAVQAPAPSTSENDPAGALVEIRDSGGNTAEEIVLIRRGDQTVRLGDRDVRVSIGPITIPVGYRVHLDDFVLVTYPGSNNPASFESHVRLYDPAHGIDGRPVRIYMNHPLTYRGFKHFQSSYDQDRRGTVLSVNNDPGKWPTYVGYILMTLGFLITLSRGVLWHRRSDARPAFQK